MEQGTVPKHQSCPYEAGHVFDDGTYVQVVDDAFYIARALAPEKVVRIHAGENLELLLGGTRPVPDNIRTVLTGVTPSVTLDGARALLLRLTKDDYEELNAIDLEDSDLEEADNEDSPESDEEYVLDDFVVADEDDSEASVTTALTDVDQSNILPPGKRRRRSTRTIYDEPDFQEQISETMLADVPDDELDAALSDEALVADDGSNSDDYDDKNSSCEDDDDSESDISDDITDSDND